MKKKLFLIIFLCFLNIFSVSAHFLYLSWVNSDLEIKWNIIKMHTTANVPYYLYKTDDKEEEKAILESTSDYIKKTFYIANNGKLCNFWGISIYPDEKTDASTFIDWKFTCNSQIKNISDLIIKSELFKDIASDSWTHFISLKNKNNEKKDIILTFNENFYPNNKETQELTKTWSVFYNQDNFSEENTEKTEKIQNTENIENKNIKKETQKTETSNILKIIKQFIYVGIKHIILWFDHILFIISLVILFNSVKNILKLTITFTIAHSITLILAALWILSLTGKIVEPLIALSIVYMALENIFILKNKKQIKINRRIIITFLFWLIHWLGFAGALSEIKIPEQFFISALLSFNVWVEIWQLAIVFIILVPILYFIKKYSWREKALQFFSLFISIIALYWFIERIFL